ncbi:MAG: hypothetical protein U0263_33825 [Polyangiaceae bacterium]
MSTHRFVLGQLAASALGLAGALARPALATTYYVAPNGSDSASGTSQQAPWKTFAHAIPKLGPGDVLTLLDGEYTKGGSGALVVNCASGAKSGTVQTPITVRAANERKAWLKGDGSYVPASSSSCAYWVFEGLHVSSADLDGSSNADVFAVADGDHLTFRRNLFHHNNRYKNSHLLPLVRVNHSLVEENEFYWFHRHAVMAFHSTGSITTGNVFRRNYCNSRGHADLPGGFPSGKSFGGDDCIVLYPGRESIAENTLSEGTSASVSITSKTSSVGNLVLGSVSIGDDFAVLLRQRSEDPSAPPKDTTIRDLVAIRAAASGVYVRGSQNTHCESSSFFSASSGRGLVADQESGIANTGLNSTFVLNTVAIGGTYGFLFANQKDWGADYTNATGAATAYSPDDAHVTHENVSDPKLGACYLWIPDGSPLKGAGKGGADIGANVLYAYEDGVLTSKKLWDPSTGEWLHGGAIVAGVNDVPGQSLFDVHERLHVNNHGCSFPKSYVDSGGTGGAGSGGAAGSGSGGVAGSGSGVAGSGSAGVAGSGGVAGGGSAGAAGSGSGGAASGGSAAGATGGASSSGGASSGAPSDEDGGGCGCRAAQSGGTSAWSSVLGLLLVAWRRARRSRAETSAREP